MAITGDDLKRLSLKTKISLMLLLFCLAGYFYYMFYLQDAWAKKENLTAQSIKLQEEVRSKEKIAADIEKFKADLESLEKEFQVALQKLPDGKEIPLLLESISVEGRNSGIEFLLFEPVPIIPRVVETQNVQKTGAPPPPAIEEFYQEIPVRVRIVGTYDDTLEFMQRVSRLPRIINVEDLVVGGDSGRGGRTPAPASGRLITSCVLKTYMFLEK